ncbi:MAG: ABC transporter permease [Jatrophihabitantaceae bacterium]
MGDRGIGAVLTALGLVLRTPNAVMSIGFVILFPLAFASNIFVDPHTMPGWLRAFADANPITHLASAARGLMAGTATAHQVLWVLAAAAAITLSSRRSPCGATATRTDSPAGNQPRAKPRGRH